MKTQQNQVDESLPGIGGTMFKIVINEPWYRNTYVIVSKPHRKWTEMVLQYITLGLYRAPWRYNVKPNSKT